VVAARDAGLSAEDQAAMASVRPAAAPAPAAFALKHLNIVDPLLPTNNLGRSVSKASFARIRRTCGRRAAARSELAPARHRGRNGCAGCALDAMDTTGCM
jgi:hypothetical protein